jgi:hypothetical protein
VRRSAEEPGTSPACHSLSGTVIGVFHEAKATIAGQIIAVRPSRPDRANMPPKDLLKVNTRYVELFIVLPRRGVRQSMKP